MDVITQCPYQLFTAQGNHYLLSTGPDLISRYLREGKAWEPHTLAISRHLIEGIYAPVLLDIGANLGAWSVPMGQTIKAVNGTLHAWEPQRRVHQQLCANLLINNLDNCFATHSALGDYSGKISVPVLDLTQDKNAGAVSLLPAIFAMQGNRQPVGSEDVAITTLNILNLPRADLIKIDVEGMELEVLRGGKAWLKQVNSPPLLFEVWGDTTPALVEKKNALLHLVKNELGYEYDILGDLCVAQQPQQKRLNIICGENGYRLEKITPFGMDFMRP